MIIVTTLNIIVVVMAYLARCEKQRDMLLWAFILLSLIYGIRYCYGSDYMEYYKVFEQSFSIRNEDQEYGWHLLNCLFHPVGFYGLVFFLTCSENYIIYVIIRRYVPKEWFWFAVFIYVFNIGYLFIGLSMMRQFLAMCIGLYSFKFIEKRELFPFLLLCSLATSFHVISVLLFPLYLTPYINKLFSNKIATVLLLIGLYFLYVHMAEVVLNFVIGMKENDLSYANTSYVSVEELSEEKNVRVIHLIRIVVYIVFFVRNFRDLNKSQQMYSTIVLLGFMIIPFAVYMKMVLRASWIYTFAEIVAFPYLLNQEKKRLLKFPLVFVYMVFILYEYFEIFTSPIYGASYIHFRTIFETLL